MGTLYIIATPIGNVGDISIRALQTLFEVDIIACEDTRKTGLLLQKIEGMVKEDQPLLEANIRLVLNKKPRLISYYDQVEQQKTPEILNLLLQGLNVALVSDAGTPLVSDPGFRVVNAAIGAGIQVVAIPGPSSVIAALTVSGLPTDKFFFLGYLPKKSGHRKELLESLKSLTGQLKTTIIFFEAPHRLVGTLEELQDIFGAEKHVVIARELTKTHEEVRRESISRSLEHFKKIIPKGEFVVLFSTQN